MTTLKYKDEKDRAYGLCGMAVCMYVMENSQYVDSVSVDAEADYGLRLTPDFFHESNQQLSAKAAWNNAVSRFQAAAGLLVANVLARALVREKGDVSVELNKQMLKRLEEEAEAACALDADEVRTVYSKVLSIFNRVFSHHDVGVIVDRFVDELMQRRTLDADDIHSLLHALTN